jgi:parallel beta-helix repeat protein
MPKAQAAVARGPQASITCPVGSVNIDPGQSIQTAVNNNVGAKTFCIKSGIHTINNPIRPKTGNTFIGEFGAILDGTGWTTTDPEAGAFRAHNEDIDNVTIKNLVIRNMPKKGIHAYYWMSDHWTIENNEIANNKYGIEFPPDSNIRNNYIHHNVGDSSGVAAERGGGYISQHNQNSILENNEISYNGMEQKVLLSTNVTFRGNFVHHNLGDGIWFDSNYEAPFLIEDNLVEDNGRIGIDVEATTGVTIRNNVIRRSGDDAIFIFRTQNTEIYNNTMENNFRGIEYFIICGDLLPGEELQNVSAHDNTIVVGTQSGAYANGLSYLPGNCSSAQLAAYLNGSKNLTFSNNRYYVPNLSANYWIWQTLRSWSQWQAIPQDSLGSVAVGNPPSEVLGDINSDHIVNAIDYSILNADWFTNATRSDLNKDGIVNAIDFSLLNANWFKTW